MYIASVSELRTHERGSIWNRKVFQIFDPRSTRVECWGRVVLQISANERNTWEHCRKWTLSIKGYLLRYVQLDIPPKYNIYRLEDIPFGRLSAVCRMFYWSLLAVNSLFLQFTPHAGSPVGFQCAADACMRKWLHNTRYVELAVVTKEIREFYRIDRQRIGCIRRVFSSAISIAYSIKNSNN